MTENVMASDWCFNVPIDHRLKPLLSSQPQKSSKTGLGSHLTTLERHGRGISRPTSENEIKFGQWLARPMGQGGLVVALLQPAPHQQYTSNIENVKNECVTLYWLDSILQVIGHSTLEKTSCFDAFPFCLEKASNRNCPLEMRHAYEVFLRMIRQKKPDVILGAWQAPKGFGEVQCCSKGVGATDETETIVVGGSPIKLVNAFHPSYAINYHPNESCFRQLFILETAKAFGELNGRWLEEGWMRSLRASCRQRATDLAKGAVSTSSPFLNISSLPT